MRPWWRFWARGDDDLASVREQERQRAEVLAARDAIAAKWIDYCRTFEWAEGVPLVDRLAPFLTPLAHYLERAHPKLLHMPTDNVLELIGAGLLAARTHPPDQVRKAIEEAKINCRVASRG